MPPKSGLAKRIQFGNGIFFGCRRIYISTTHVFQHVLYEHNDLTRSTEVYVNALVK
jgi:hypothetical protein